MVAVHPVTQIVRPMLAWLTDGLTAPGVRAEFGRTAPAALTVMPPEAWAGFGTAGTLGADTMFGVVTAAGVGGDETVLDDDVGLDRDVVAGRLEVGPQPDSSTMAASSAVIDVMALFMFCLLGPGAQPCCFQRQMGGLLCRQKRLVAVREQAPLPRWQLSPQPCSD